MTREPDHLELEPIERRVYADLYEALPSSIATDCGILWSDQKDTLRLTCRTADHPFFNRVMGVGTTAPEAERWLAEITEHYRSNGITRWMLQVPPSDETAAPADVLSRLGLVRLRGWAKHLGAVTRISPSETRSSDLRVESIGTHQAGDWSSILAPAFDYPAGAEAWLAATVGRPGWRHYVAYDGSEPAACAALIVTGNVGTLAFAATRPSHRRRGAQTALITARIRDARRLGLEWIATETDEELPERPNPSYRNIIRAGMPVRYVRANWGLPPPPAKTEPGRD